MSGDNQFINLPLIAAFLKAFSRTYLGSLPDSTETLPDGVEELVPVEIQAKMRELFVGYFNAASKALIKGQIVSDLSSSTDGRNCSSKTSGITRRTSSRVKSLKIVNKHTKR